MESQGKTMSRNIGLEYRQSQTDVWLTVRSRQTTCDACTCIHVNTNNQAYWYVPKALVLAAKWEGNIHFRDTPAEINES